MNKKIISGIIIAVMILSNVYLVYRVSSNNMTIASYDAGISQRSGVGQLESFWTKYIGGSKKSQMTYEDRENAESDSSISIAVLCVIDIACAVALYKLNHTPKPAPVIDEDEEEWRRRQRRSRRRY